jgi:2-amino-4-hydroxy-6-hydroxymethyldihydropteridine diphosphokinase
MAEAWQSRVFIGLGSNQGERNQWLARARARLQNAGEIKLLKASSLYETEPHGFLAQPSFLNQVIEVATTLSPQSLLARLLKIENGLGRVRAQRWGPRNIDLDLLAYGGHEIVSATLRLPHPEIPHRRFVLEPWREIAPDFRIAKWQLTVAELLAQCEDRGQVLWWKN